MRCYPVLAVGAVQIAAKHAEAVGERAGIRVEKWLFLDRIALSSGSVFPGNKELATAVVAHFANTGLAFGDGTAMSASKTAHTVVVEFLDKGGFGFADTFVEDSAEGGHGWFYFNARSVRNASVVEMLAGSVAQHANSRFLASLGMTKQF